MEIKFEPAFELAKEYPPLPAKKMIPEWFKNLDLTTIEGHGTAKQCPPMIDFFTSGYYIRSVGNFHFKREVVNDEEDITISGDFFADQSESSEYGGQTYSMPLLGLQVHDQIPVVINGIKKSFWKFYEFWVVHTPPGYSCLFLPPTFFYQPFEIVPAIVDTDDDFCVPQSFPTMCSARGNETIEWDVKKGDPIVLVIPFKRDDWKHTNMDIDHSRRKKMIDKNILNYKDNYHKPKKFK
jgi:hypothetical protein